MTPSNGGRVLVTGAAGFIGANLVNALAASGLDVHGLVRPGSTSWRLGALSDHATVHGVDLADADGLARLVRAVAPAVVFHAAASSHHHPVTPEGRRRVMTDTVLSTVNVCDAIRGLAGCRLVYLGSSLEYRRASAPLTEASACEPATFRGASKLAATVLCRQMAREARVSLVELRLFSVFGPWEGPSRFVPAVMRALRDGAELPLTRPGIRRDFIFIGDVTDACLRAAWAEGVDGEAFNVGSGVETANEAVVAAAERVSGRRARVIAGGHAGQPADTDHWCADISKARRLLGWEPAHSLDAGLATAWAWTLARAELPTRAPDEP